MDLSGVPEDYWDLQMVFSKHRSETLPSTCSPAQLLPGAGYFPFLLWSRKLWMNIYRRFYTWGSSPHPPHQQCIDYHGLIAFTQKDRYPLPLMNSAFDHLQWAKVFSKLDLCSAYNPAFITPSDHYKYLVMTFGLMNAWWSSNIS